MRELTIAGYLLCLIAAALLELAARRRESPLATLGELLDEVLSERAPRLTILLFWWWLGWHFLFARTIDPPVG